MEVHEDKFVRAPPALLHCLIAIRHCDQLHIGFRIQDEVEHYDVGLPDEGNILYDQDARLPTVLLPCRFLLGLVGLVAVAFGDGRGGVTYRIWRGKLVTELIRGGDWNIKVKKSGPVNNADLTHLLKKWEASAPVVS